MDSKLYIQRAENELKLSRILFEISLDVGLQRDIFEIQDPETYFSAVIGHSYCAIFYAAKAYLSSRGLKTSAPEEHKKTLNEFKKLVNSGELDVELLKLYEEAIIRADYLLGIFKLEKKKRGKFTYRTLPHANKQPASESLSHAKEFFKHLYGLI